MIKASEVTIDGEGNFRDLEGNQLYLSDGTTPITKSTVKLAYFEGLKATLIHRVSGATTYSMNDTLTVNYLKADNANAKSGEGWYISAGGGYAKLTDDATKLNHITMVFDSSNTVVGDEKSTTEFPYDYSSVKVHFFIDGEHFGTTNIGNTIKTYVNASTSTYMSAEEIKAIYSSYVGTEGKWVSTFDVKSGTKTATHKVFADSAGFYEARFEIANANYNNATEYEDGTSTGLDGAKQKLFAFCLDNVATNCYENGYSGQLAEFISKDLETKNIYVCDDVVYTNRYDIPGKDPVAEITVTDIIDDEPVNTTIYYDIMYGAIRDSIRLQRPVTITRAYMSLTRRRVTRHLWLSREMRVFDSAATYRLTYSDGVYTVTPITKDNLFTIEWFLDFENNTAMEADSAEKNLAVGSPISYTGDIPAPTPTSDPAKFSTIVGWEYSIDWETWYPLTEGATITDELAENIKTNGWDNVLTVRAVYGETTALYTVTKDGEGVGYLDSKNFTNNVTNLPSGSLVTFYDDILIASNASAGSIIIPKNSEVSFDLNGYSLTFEKTFTLFTISDVSKLNVYSSKIGGKIDHEKRIIYQQGTLSGTVVTFGKLGDVAGENAKHTISCSVLFDGATASTNTDDTNDYLNPLTLNIYGVNATRGISDTYALISARRQLKLNVENSILVATTARVLSTDGRYRGGFDAYIKNSTLISTSDQIIKELNIDSRMVFEDCVLIGKTTITKGQVLYNGNEKSESAIDDASYTPISDKGVVILKGDTKIKSNDNVYPSNYVVDSDTATVKINLACSEPYYTGSKMHTYTAKNFTWAFAEIDGDKYAEITFNGHDTPEYWYVGSKLSAAGVNEYGIDGLYNKVINYRNEKGKSVDIAVKGTYSLVGDGEYVYEANISGIKVNLSANNGFVVNFYVPRDLQVFTSVPGYEYDSEYMVYSVKTSVAGNGTGELSQSIKVSVVDYFNAVLAQSFFDEAAKDLVVNAANYANEIYKYANGTDFDGYKAIVDANSDRIIEANVQPVDVNAQTQNVFSDVQLIITEGNVPVFAFKKTGGGSVSVKYAGVFGEYM